MPVFISHRTIDNSIALEVKQRLETWHGITCYIDDLDRAAGIARTTRQITGLILQRLESCTHLLAVVTENTKGSWWVPFEVGVARRAPRAISTYTPLCLLDSPGLPEFLTEWPVLRGKDAVDTFARIYKEQRFKAKTMMEKHASAEERMSVADAFHSRMKDALGQR
jgi:hypothetical protein